MTFLVMREDNKFRVEWQEKNTGSTLPAFAATIMLLPHLKILPLITFAFLPMLISGLVFIFGSMWTVRKGKYSLY